MKKTIVVALLLTVCSFSGIAQEKKGSGSKKESAPGREMSIDQRVINQTDKAERELGLNADQKAKWAIAVRERITANKAIKEKLQGATTPEERKKLHADAKANQQKFEETISVFLTPDQKTKYESLKQQKKSAVNKHSKSQKSGVPATNEAVNLDEN